MISVTSLLITFLGRRLSNFFLLLLLPFVRYAHEHGADIRNKTVILCHYNSVDRRIVKQLFCNSFTSIASSRKEKKIC